MHVPFSILMLNLKDEEATEPEAVAHARSVLFGLRLEKTLHDLPKELSYV